jgi:hypothetical protein
LSEQSALPSFDSNNRGIFEFSPIHFTIDKDTQYNKGIRIDNNIYEINNFQMRFFTTQQIKYFLNHNFIINRIIEDYEEPASLYFVFTTKQ